MVGALEDSSRRSPHTGARGPYFCSAVESGARDCAHQCVLGSQVTALAPEGGGLSVDIYFRLDKGKVLRAP